MAFKQIVFILLVVAAAVGFATEAVSSAAWLSNIEIQEVLNKPSEGIHECSPYTAAIVKMDNSDEESREAAKDLALWLLKRKYIFRAWPILNDRSNDPIYIAFIDYASGGINFKCSTFIQQHNETRELFYVIIANDNSVNLNKGELLKASIKNSPPVLEAVLRFSLPLSLHARMQALIRDGNETIDDQLYPHIASTLKLQSGTQISVMQYGIAEAKLGNRVEAEQAKAVAQHWSSIPNGAFKVIAGTMGLGPTWPSRENDMIILRLQDVLGGQGTTVLSEKHDTDADGWLYRAQAALELRSPICALLAARRAIALGKHEAAALAATACDQLGLAHSAQAYRAWPSLFKDP